jgi:hypothetical protein
MRNMLFSVLVGVLAAGCGDSGGSGGAGGTGGSGGMVMPPPLSKGSASSNMPADYSCLGHFMDPAGANAPFAVNGKVSDFQTKNPVPMAVIAVYPDVAALMANQPADMKTCDANGQFTGLMIPAMHYRVVFKTVAPPDQIDTYEVNIPVDPASTTPLDRNSVSHFTATALPGLVGVDYDSTKAVVAGGVRDCAGSFVRGGLISINAGGAVPDSQVFYFSDQDLPVRKTLQQYTNYDGLFTGVNIPPGGMATITASGVVGSGSVMKIGEKAIPLFAGALTISDIPPL